MKDTLHFKHTIEIHHLDGSKLYLNHSNYENITKNRVDIFTEHIGNFKVHLEDLEMFIVDNEIIFKNKEIDNYEV